MIRDLLHERLADEVIDGFGRALVSARLNARMPRYVAFLRAVNVGGRVVKMEALRRIFESAGLTNVETFIASGNVLFDSGSRSEKALRAKIEKSLQNELGYSVVTFLRDSRRSETDRGVRAVRAGKVPHRRQPIVHRVSRPAAGPRSSRQIHQPLRRGGRISGGWTRSLLALPRSV